MRSGRMLRGSRTNWVENVSFYLIDRDLLETLAEHDNSSNTWDLSLFDNVIYLSTNGRDFHSSIQHVDIWDEFQVSIANMGA